MDAGWAYRDGRLGEHKLKAGFRCETSVKVRQGV